jgi:hypothetical protein
MKNIAYILVLFSLPSCSQTNTDKKEKGPEEIVINLVGDSIQVFDDSQVGNFFKILFEKYNNDYYPLGSGITFSEGITASEPDSYHSKSAFLIIDSLKTGNDKYVIDITPEIIRQQSHLRIYKGKYGCHWELSVDGCEWMGFTNGIDADFIFNSEDGGYDKDFAKALNKIDFKDNEEKETFSSAILNVISIHFAPDLTTCERTKVEFDWIDNNLTVTHHYSDSCTNYKDGRPKEEIDFKHVLEFEFEKDRIKNMKRIIKK